MNSMERSVLNYKQCVESISSFLWFCITMATCRAVPRICSMWGQTLHTFIGVLPYTDFGTNIATRNSPAKSNTLTKQHYFSWWEQMPPLHLAFPHYVQPCYSDWCQKNSHHFLSNIRSITKSIPVVYVSRGIHNGEKVGKRLGSAVLVKCNHEQPRIAF